MAQGKPVGQMYVELSLDSTKYTAAQKSILAGAQKNSADINRVFRTVGTQTDEMYNAMRQNIQNALNAIKKSHLSTADEIRRAQQSAAIKLAKIDKDQFGERLNLLDSFKKNWLAATAAIAAVTVTASKVWDMAKVGAGYDEQAGMLDNLARKYTTTADTIIEEMDRASKFQIAKSELMTIALGGIAKGLNPKQLIDLANAADTLGDAAGKTATEALKDLTEALETGRTRGLTTYLGTTLDLETALGDLASELTSAEKAQAMYNMTMMAAIEIQGQVTTEIDDAADRIAQIEKRFDDATLAAARFFKTMVVGALDMPKRLGEGMLLEGEIAMGGPIGTRIKGPKAPEVTEARYLSAWKARTDPYQEAINNLREAAKARKDEADAVKNVSKAEAERLRLLKETAELNRLSYEEATKQALAEENYLGDLINYTKTLNAEEKFRLDQNIKLREERQKLERTAAEKYTERMYEWEWPTEQEMQKMVQQGDEFSKVMFDLTRTTAQAMERNFSDLFFNVMKGNFDSLEDYANAVLDSIMRATADYLAMLATNQLFGAENPVTQKREGGFLSQIGDWIKGSGTIGGGFGGGTAAAGALSLDEAMGMLGGSFHQGGIMGAGGYRIPRLHAGLKPDEYPAILQAGEEVIPKDEAGKKNELPIVNVNIQAVDAASFMELTNRNPQAIIGPFISALKHGGYIVDTIRSVVR